MNRLQLAAGAYGLGFVATVLMMAIIPLIAPAASGGGFVATPTAMTAIYLTQALPSPFIASMLWRRAHDLGLRGYIGVAPLGVALAASAIAAPLGISLNNTWQGAIIVVPVFIVLLYVIFAPQEGENRFGAEQRGWNVGKVK